jgi:hypothetical protein
MKEYYIDTPEVRYPNLFFEVSDKIQYFLRGYKIEHTKAEMVLLRDNALKGLNKAGITQETYNLINLGKIDGWIIEDSINFEINNFYRTNHCIADLRNE